MSVTRREAAEIDGGRKDCHSVPTFVASVTAASRLSAHSLRSFTTPRRGRRRRRTPEAPKETVGNRGTEAGAGRGEEWDKNGTQPYDSNVISYHYMVTYTNQG